MNYIKSAPFWRLISPLIVWGAVGLADFDTARAETYNEWLSAAADNSGSLLAISPLPGAGSPETSSTVNDYRQRFQGALPAGTQFPIRPPGGAVGQLPLTGLSARHLPATLRIFASELEVEDIAPVSGKTHFNVWSADAEILDRNAPIRKTLFEEEIVLDTAPRLPILLRLPVSNQRAYWSPTLFSLRIELRDSQGSIVARALPVPVYRPVSDSGAQALVAADGNLERYFRDSLHLTSIRTLRKLPEDVWAFAEMPVVGLSTEILNNSQLSSTAARQALLSGVQFFGSVEAIRKFAELAEVPQQARVLLGKLRPISEAEFLAPPEPNSYEYYSPINLAEPHSTWQQLGSNNYAGIFSSYKSTYTRWTVMLLTSFSIVLIVGIPFGFFFLPPKRRLHIWWGVPALAVTVSLIGFVLGNSVLPRAPLLQISEYRFAYAPWPEVYHRVGLRVLSFRNEELTFTGHPDLSLAASLAPSYDRGEPLQIKLRRNSQQAALLVINPNRGNPQVLEARFFSDTELPLEAQYSSNGFSLKAKRNIKRGYVLDATKSYEFGPLRTGAEVSRSQLISPSAVVGLSQSLATYLELAQNYNPQSRGSKNFTIGRQFLGDAGIIVIASTDETPSLTTTEASSIVSSEVIWLMQFGSTGPGSAEGL